MMLSPEQSAKLERLRLFATRYEVELVHPDGRRVLLGYTARKSRPGLRALARPRVAAIWRWLGVPQGSETTWAKRGPEIRVWGGGAIRFSGRTQRDAIMEGELQEIT